MPRFSVDAVVVCDDIRKEVTGKDILIGVYGGTILVAKIPATIPIALWLEIEAHDVGKIQLELRVSQPNEKSLVEVQMELGVSSHSTYISLHTPTIPCQISQEGAIEIAIRELGEQDWTIIKTKRVAIRPPNSGLPLSPTGQPPPSEQSQPDAPKAVPRSARRRPSTRPRVRTLGPE